MFTNLKNHKKIMNKNELLRKIELKVAQLQRKARISKLIFLTCSILLIVMSAFNGILSAYAITKNPNPVAINLFVAISFINAVVTFVTSLSSFFVFENVYTKNSAKIDFFEKKKIELKNPDCDIDVIAEELIIYKGE